MNTCRCHTRLLKVVMATLNESLLLIHSVDFMCMVNIEGDINHWNDWLSPNLWKPPHDVPTAKNWGHGMIAL